MKLVQTVLRNISNDKPLLAQGDYSLPVLALAEAFNVSAVQRANTLSHESSGQELKEALSSLDESQQMRLLHVYKRHVEELLEPHSLPGELPPAVPKVVWNGVERRVSNDLEKEKVRLRHWLIKWGFIFFAPIPCVMVGAMMVIAVGKGAMPDSVVVSGVMTTATEILKVIFNLSS